MMKIVKSKVHKYVLDTLCNLVDDMGVEKLFD